MTPRLARACLFVACALALASSLGVSASSLKTRSSMRSATATAAATHGMPFLFKRANRLFKTSSAEHVEPLLDFRVLHVDNAHLHSAETIHPDSDHPLKTGNAANSIGAHSMRTRLRNGHTQPFPDSISVSFRAFDELFNFSDLQLEVNLYAPDSKLEVHDAHGNVELRPHTLNTYVTRASRAGNADSEGWAVVTLDVDGLMIATINMGDEMYQVNPLFVGQHERDDETHAALKAVAVHNMVVTRHSDMTHLKTGGHACGAVKKSPRKLKPEDILFHKPGMHAEEDEEEEEVSTQTIASTRRRLLANFPPGQGVTRWTSCYANDNVAHKVSYGVVSDYGYYAVYGSTANVQNSISNIWAAVNAVYMAQFNMYIEINNVIIKTAADSTPWNKSPATLGGRCDVDGVTSINTHLDDLTTWRYGSQTYTYSAWHMMTACWPAPGTVGLAYIGALCNSRYGTGTSSYSGTTWLTVAHEIGHNFNAQHSFQDGQGTTGGIMDYGDGIYPLGSGIYQFNQKYNQAEMCAYIDQTQTAALSSTIQPYCFANYAPVCGNGVVEAGEECDDSTSCCNNLCRLQGVCTPGNSNTNECCLPSCTYKPTTTLCNNGLGFCGNGICQAAICASYGMSVCGFETSGCKLRCGGGASAQQCTSTWQSPDCNIPSGFYCSSSPSFSTCSGTGTCVPSTPPVTYAWSSGAWSACSCSGTNTRTVTCVSSTGATAADTACAGTKPDTSGSCAVPTSCFLWQQSTWSACSVDCGSGTQTASVACVQGPSSPSPGATVSSSQCAGTAPLTQQACSPQACPTQWKVSGFSGCTVSCGGGTQTQTVQCVQTQNGLVSTVGAQYCSAPQPATSQACNTLTCQDGSWTYSPWSTCTKDCGSGTQTRTVTCTVGDAPAAGHCQNAGATEALSQSCNTGICPSYAWGSGTWSACTVSCGGGTQTRSANCYDNANDPGHTIPQNSNFCTLSMPTTIQACQTTACPIPPNYQWSSGAWGTCSVSCGGGVSSRTVGCVNSVDSSSQTDDKCSAAGTKPATQQACSQQGCPTYSWIEAGWSSCSKSCGTGVQTQTVTCRQDGTTNTVASSFCSGASPLTSRACSTDPCPPAVVPHTWQQGTGSPCSAQCNGGTQSFTPLCFQTDVTPNKQIDASVCADLAKPPTQGVCNTAQCPTFWSSGTWGACSASCGPSGTQTRTVGCFYSTDNTATATPLADSKCTSSKPATVTACNTTPCPTWQYSSAWSTCSQACNQGIQTRNIICANSDGSKADVSSCGNQVAPPVQQTCQIIPCPHWHRNLWGDCNKPCADSLGPGTQNRTVLCRMPHDDPAWNGIVAKDDTLCPAVGVGDVGDGDGQPGVANGKPPSVQICATDACPKYYWVQSEPGPCSKSCGGGVRTAKVVCTVATTGAPAPSENLCLDAPPPSTYACNTFDCPQLRYITGNWTDCSSFCATGNQTRSVTCRNDKPDPSVHFPWIDMELAECEPTLGKAPASSQVCVQPESTCWGAEPGVKNGRCEIISGAATCLCRTGYSGPKCATLNGITNVKTNGAIFGASGVPLGQPLLISWDSSTTMQPYIDVVLRRNSTEWPVGQYLAQHITNTGSWSWTVGSILQSGLDGGSGYSVRVWYSANSYADSAEFTIADPCAYMSCGLHGTCSRGLCECSAGYSGAQCMLGPCEKATCDPDTARCNNTEVISSGRYLTPESVCTCLDNYSGSQCKTPPSCALTTSCLNGGDLSLVQLTTTSCTGTCACRGLWKGTNCGMCGLQCSNGGTPSADCTSCVNCNAGFFGQRCECQYFRFGFKLLTDVSEWNANPTAKARWSRTLELDVVSAASTVTPFKTEATVENLVVIAGVKPAVAVALRWGLSCTSTSTFGGDVVENDRFDYASYEPVHGPSSKQQPGLRLLGQSANREFSPLHSSRRLLQVAGNELIESYNAILPLLSDRDSALWQGQVTSNLDPNAAVTAADPSGLIALTPPGKPVDCFETSCSSTGGSGGNGNPSSSTGVDVPITASDSSDSLIDRIAGSPLYLGLFFTGAGIILTAIGVTIFFWVRRYRANKDVSSHIKRLGSNGLESEMTENPALASINNANRWNQI